MNSLIQAHPIRFLLVVIFIAGITLHLTAETATIEMIDGKEYVTAIDGKQVEPRRPTVDDLDMKWDRK